MPHDRTYKATGSPEKVSLSVSPQILQRIDDCAMEDKVSRNRWIIDAIERKLQEVG